MEPIEHREGRKKMSWKRRLKIAFVVLGILGLLAVIAIPNFLKLQAKSKCSETKQNLGAIFTGLVAYFGEFNTYAGSGIINGKKLDAFELLKWAPQDEYHCRYIMDVGDIPANVGDKSCDIPHRSKSSQTGFTACATANIDSDPFCDVWCINDDKIMKNMTANEYEWLDDGDDVDN